MSAHLSFSSPALLLIGLTIALATCGPSKVESAAQNSGSCELSEVKPTVDLKEQQIVKSGDNRALVAFAGYLEYVKDDEAGSPKVFLPLSLESVVLNDLASAGTLSLKTDCAQLDFYYTKFSTEGVHGRGISIEDIKVSLTLPNGTFGTCKVTSDFDMVLNNPNNHYSCELPREHLCDTEVEDQWGITKKSVAKLILNAFKFQTDGNEEKTKNLEFSGEAEQCELA